MASRSTPSSSSRSPSAAAGRRTTAQKSRSEGERATARASGGVMLDKTSELPAGSSASTGVRAERASVRRSMNSRSSNSGRQRSQGGDSTRAAASDRGSRSRSK